MRFWTGTSGEHACSPASRPNTVRPVQNLMASQGLAAALAAEWETNWNRPSE